MCKKCNRGACQAELTEAHGYVRIQNQLTTLGSWHEYCVRCARRILEAGWMPNEVFDKKIGGFRPWIAGPATLLVPPSAETIAWAKGQNVNANEVLEQYKAKPSGQETND